MSLKEQVEIIAFDIDGTIFSSEDIILSTYEKSISSFIHKTGKNIKVPEREKIMEQVGKPVKTIFKNLMPSLEEDERDTISENVLKFLCESIQNGGGKIYPGVFETVAYLKQSGYRLVAASNGRKPYITTILQTSKISPFFEPIIAIDYQNIMTKSDILLNYSNLFKVNPQKIAIIGDRYSDEEAARQAGTKFVFCEYGHAPSGEVSYFDYKIARFTDLESIF